MSWPWSVRELLQTESWCASGDARARGFLQYTFKNILHSFTAQLAMSAPHHELDVALLAWMSTNQFNVHSSLALAHDGQLGTLVHLFQSVTQ